MKSERLKEKMKGIIIVQATPFGESGLVDLEGLRANTKFLVEETADKDVVLVPVTTMMQILLDCDE